MTALYIPAPRNQFTSDPAGKCDYRHENCWVETAIWARAGATAGADIPTAAKIRHLAGKDSCRRVPKIPRNHLDGPGNLQDVDRALEALGTHFAVEALTVARAKQDLSNAANAALYVVPTHFDVWPELKRCQPNFTGFHAVGLIPGLNSSGQIQVMNPLCGDYEWVGLTHVLAAMQSYSEHHDRIPKGAVKLGYIWRPKVEPEPAPVADSQAGPQGTFLRAYPGQAAPVIRALAPGTPMATGLIRTGVGWETINGDPGSWWAQVLAVKAGELCNPPLWAALGELAPLP